MDKKPKLLLASALRECDTLKDNAKRDTLMRNLSEAIGRNIKQQNDASIDIINILDACLDHRDGIESLIEILRYFEGDSMPMHKFDQVWSSISKLGVAPKEQCKELFDIASRVDLSNDELRKLYKASLPSGFPLRDEAKTLWPILNHLWDIPIQPDKRLPILIFIRQLARCTNNSNVADRLKVWCYQIAPKLELNLQNSDIDKMWDEPDTVADRAKASCPYLLVKITPDPNNESGCKQKLYLIDISLWRSQDDESCLYADDKPIPLENVPSSLDKVLIEIAENIPYEMANLGIEFFLPHELISCEIDQWGIEKNVLTPETKLGIKYPVVVRSLERAMNKVLWGEWIKKWEQFQKLAHAPDSKSLFWIDDQNQYDLEQLYATLISNEEASCLIVTFVPTENPGNGSILAAGIKAGISVALWPRRRAGVTSNSGAVRTKVEPIISNKNLAHLPRLIQEQRQLAISQQDQTHLGKTLALLWDDPNRLPLKFKHPTNMRLRTP